MLQEHKHWSVVPGLLVVALLAACNQDRLSPDRSLLGKPSRLRSGQIGRAHV